MRKLIATLALLFAALGATPALAQSDAQSDIIISSNGLRGGAKPEDVFNFEYGVPATPALSIIGADGDAIPRTSSLQKFAVSVLRATEQAGGGEAYALDFSPLYASGYTMSAYAYHRDENVWLRRLARTRTSLAFSEGKAGDEPVASRVGLGFVVSFLDDSDPAMARESGDVGDERNRPIFNACLSEGHAGSAESQGFGAAQRAYADAIADAGRVEAAEAAAREAFEAAFETVYDQCRERAIKLAQRSQHLDIGMAQQWRGEAGALDDLESGGTTMWATYLSRQFGPQPDAASDANAPFTRAVVSLRADFGTQELDAQGVAFEFDRQVVAFGLERTSSRSVISLQAAYETADGPAGTEFDGEAYRYLARADFPVPLGESSWLSISVGQVSGREGAEDDNYLSVALRFKGFGDAHLDIGDLASDAVSRISGS